MTQEAQQQHILESNKRSQQEMATHRASSSFPPNPPRRQQTGGMQFERSDEEGRGAEGIETIRCDINLQAHEPAPHYHRVYPIHPFLILFFLFRENCPKFVVVCLCGRKQEAENNEPFGGVRRTLQVELLGYFGQVMIRIL